MIFQFQGLLSSSVLSLNSSFVSLQFEDTLNPLVGEDGIPESSRPMGIVGRDKTIYQFIRSALSMWSLGFYSGQINTEHILEEFANFAVDRVFQRIWGQRGSAFNR